MIKNKLFYLTRINSLLCFLFFTISPIAQAHKIEENKITTTWPESSPKFGKADTVIKAPEIIAGATKICIATSTELKVVNPNNSEIVWKTSSNETVGNSTVLKVSPKKTTTFYAVYRIGNRESGPSNKITINVSFPGFTGLPSVPADYNLTSTDPFYLGTKEAEGVSIRWKHENKIGGTTLVTPTPIPTNYYVRFEEPNTGCVSDWKSVSVKLTKKNSVLNNVNDLQLKNSRILANTPAASCAALSTSSDAQLCSGTSFAALVSNTTNGGTGSTQWGCLGTRPNQSWFYFIPLTSGSISFRVTNSANVDVDGAVWGPANTVGDACTATQSAPLTCDYTSAAAVSLSIASVTAGKVYVLVITN